MSKKRHQEDRRITFVSTALHYNRRRLPDRRLSNILVEFIPLESVYVHAHTRDMFTKF